MNLLLKLISNCAEFLHPGIILVQVLLSDRFIDCLQGFDEVFLLEWDADLFLELLQVCDVLESSLVFELAAHGHVGCLSADVGYVSSTEAFGLFHYELEVNRLI